MKHRNSHLLMGYWSALRKGRDIPDQADIDPRAIKRFLSYTFIWIVKIPPPPSTVVQEPHCASASVLNSKVSVSWRIGIPSRACLWFPLLRQALKARQPVCLSSIAAPPQTAWSVGNYPQSRVIQWQANSLLRYDADVKRRGISSK